GSVKSCELEVQVITHKKQDNTPWFRGSICWVKHGEFGRYRHTEDEYDEIELSIVRRFGLLGGPG
ncbi:unnamed protein product, partial [Tuber aestivum]